MAYITAQKYYTIIRELLTGKGFAYLVLLPKTDKPAMTIELKYDHNVEAGITQIKARNYPDALSQYIDNLLLVSINYDKITKAHSCI